MKVFRKAKPEYLILGGAILSLLILVAFPLFLLIVKSFQGSTGFTMENYTQILETHRNYISFINTLKIGLLTTTLSLLIGAPLAWLVTRTNLPFAKAFRTLFVIPYIIPPFVGAVAWIQLLSGRNGYLNRIIQTLFGLKVPVFNIYTLSGLIWVMAVHFFPFVFIITTGALERMDPTLEEAARVSGAKPFRVMRDITLPLVMPSIFGGALLAFVSSISNFGIAALVGMPARLYVLTTMIFSYMYTGGFGGIRVATALSIALLITATVGLVINDLYLKKRQYTIIAGKSMRPQIIELGKWRKPMLVFSAVIVIVTVVMPIITVFITSLLKAWGSKICWENISLKNYKYILFEYGSTQKAFLNSFLFAIGSATVAMILGTLIAYIKVKTKVKGKKLLDILANLPYAIPGTVLAIAMILAWSGKYGINLYNTFWIIFVAYVTRYLSFAVRTSSSSLEQIHPSLEEAVRMSGGGWLHSLRDVVIPLIRPGLIAGWFLIFMPCLSELTLSILLWGPKTITVGVAVFEMQEAGYFQISAAMASLILIVVLGGNYLVKVVSKGKLGM
jgi:iron(III) transport system permease protein